MMIHLSIASSSNFYSGGRPGEHISTISTE